MRKPFDGDYRVTQIFGVNPQDYAQFGMKGHNGIDYALPTGTHVLAPHSGKVIEATLDPVGYGLYIKIENDIEGSVLAHFKEFRVGVGDTVTEGQLIAFSDNSGNSTGPHLHWGYYRFPRDRSNGYAGFIDQTPYLTLTNPSQPTEPIDEYKKKMMAYNVYYEYPERVIDDIEKYKKIEQELRTVISNTQLELNKKDKEIINWQKKLELLQNEIETKLAKKDIECEDKIKDFTTSLTKDFELKEINYKKTIFDLEKELKDRPTIIKEPEKPKTLKGKLEAILDILF